MSALKTAIGTLQKVFDKYAGTDGDNQTLSKKEVAALLKAELPEIDAVLNAGGPKGKEAEEFFKMLDCDGDGTVDFNEYIVFVATMAMLL